MDANATTPLLPEVMEAMRPYWMERFGNASSIHLHGQQARAAVDRARETLAEFFNCHAAEVVFNSGGTEGDNTALFGLLRRGASEAENAPLVGVRRPGAHAAPPSTEPWGFLGAPRRRADKGIAECSID